MAVTAIYLTKPLRTLCSLGLVLDVIACTKKMKVAREEERDVLNVGKLAILLLFAVP